MDCSLRIVSAQSLLSPSPGFSAMRWDSFLQEIPNPGGALSENTLTGTFIDPHKGHLPESEYCLHVPSGDGAA
jgi:hypothetical protein